jgi:hypoxanthine phosphoribosyltransferase
LKLEPPPGRHEEHSWPTTPIRPISTKKRSSAGICSASRRARWPRRSRIPTTIPEIVIAVARGGLLPAGALAYALGLKLSDAINVEFYTDVHETLPDPILLAPMLDIEAIKGKKLLVVDDVADSGRTLALVLELLRKHGAEAQSAVIYAKSASIIDPDFVWKRTDQWIVFPWSAEPPVEPSK